MPAIANCPTCEAQVSIPQGASPRARVRCPLCEQEMLLEDVLRNAPPELIVLEDPEPAGIQGRALGANGDSGGAWQSGAAEPFEDGEPTVTEEDCNVAVVTQVEVHTDTDEDQLLTYDHETNGAGSPLAVDTEEAKQGELVPVEGFEFGRGEVVEEHAFASVGTPIGGPTSIPSVASRAGRRKKGPSVFRQMIFVFGGGVVGLSLGYMILLWAVGKRTDFLKIGHKLPAFMVPAEFHGGGGGQSNNGSVITDEDIERSKAALHFSEVENTRSRDEIVKQTDRVASIEPGYGRKGEPAVFIPGEEGDPDAVKIPDDPEPMPAKLDVPEEPADLNLLLDGPDTALVVLRGGPTVTPDDLGAALKAASDSFDELVNQKFSDPQQRPLKAKAYVPFCRLGEAMAYVTGDPNVDQLGSRKKAAVDLIRKIAQPETDLNDLAALGAKWLETAKRPNSGVLLYGKVTLLEKDGDLTVVHVKVNESTHKVITARTPNCVPPEHALILGSIIIDPAANIPGFSGEEPQVIWGAVAEKVDAD